MWKFVKRLFRHRQHQQSTLDLGAYYQRLMAENEYLRDRYKHNPTHYNMLMTAYIPHLKRIGFSDKAISQLTENIPI
jgi:hypothetical protein